MKSQRAQMSSACSLMSTCFEPCGCCLQVTVSQSHWNVMISASMALSLQITKPEQLAQNVTDGLQRIQNDISTGKTFNDATEFKENLALAGGKVQSASSVGLALRGSMDGHVVRIGYIAGEQKIHWIPVCWNDNHDMCGPGHTCWAFICLPKMDSGLPCTHDVHCKSGHCGDEKGALWCVQCSQDEHCAADQFCEAGLQGAFAGTFAGGPKLYECRGRVSLSLCDARQRFCMGQ